MINELRLGNIVRFEDGTETKVNGIHPSGNYIHNGKQWIEIFRFEPIPITPEILIERFGFEQEHFGDPVYFKNDDVGFVVDLHEGEITWENQIYKNSYCHHPLPEFVHDLQNFYYSLTKKEL